MMITTCLILWIPVAGAILILTVGEAPERLRTVVGTIARHCSVRPIVNLWELEKTAPRFSLGRATVTQRGPTRRWSDTTSPAWPGLSWPLNVSASPATANVAVLASVTKGRTYWATVRLLSPRVVTAQSRLVETEPARNAKLYVPAEVVKPRATGVNPCWLG